MILLSERSLAKVLTGALWLCGTALMVEAGLQAPAPDWVAIGTTPIVWIVVISLPIFAHAAFAERAWIAAALLVPAAVFGSAYTLTGTISRQAENRDAKVAIVEASNFPIEQKKADLERAKQRLEDAQRYADDERSNGGCKTRCQDWQLRATEVQARVDKLETEIKGLGPTRPAAPGDARIAGLIHWLPWVKSPADEVEKAWETFSPCQLGLVIELAALALGYYGWRSGSGTKTETVSRPIACKERPVELVSDEVRATIQALSRAGKPVSNDQLARMMRCSKGEASKRVAALNGRVLKHRDPDDARQVRISLLN